MGFVRLVCGPDDAPFEQLPMFLGVVKTASEYICRRPRLTWIGLVRPIFYAILYRLRHEAFYLTSFTPSFVELIFLAFAAIL